MMIANIRHQLRATIVLTPLMLGMGLAGPAAIAQQRVGVNGAVNPTATGIPPGGAPRRLVLGQEVVFKEHITTEVQGQTQILFADQSTMTVGPNSDLVIDEFVYDPNAGTGKMAASLTRGVFRYVGGKLSKHDNAVTLQTPAATIGIRGGVVLGTLTGGNLRVIFAYGKGVTITGLNGVSQTITRPGFQSIVSGPGASPSAPAPAPPGTSAAVLAQVNGRSGATGGATTVPTNAMAENTGVATTSNTVPAVQTQTQQPPNVNNTVQQAQTTLQVTANSGLDQLAAPTTTTAAAIVTPTTTPTTPIIPATPPPPPPPPAPPAPPAPSVTVSYAGNFKSTNGQGTAGGMLDPGGTSSVGVSYSGGALAYPQGSPQNGVFTATIGSSQLSIPLPYVPGTFTLPANGAGTTSPAGPVTGTTFMSSDLSFFYANLTPVNSPTQAEFIFGGQPVNQSFYAPNPKTQFYAFNLQPDAALQSPIPFVTNSTGGSVPNATVSPLYVVAPANTQFGANNINTNPNVNSPHYLQSSLAINGQGANQSSVLVISTGSFFTSSDTGTVVASGPVRGSYFAPGMIAPVQTRSAASTVPDAAGNNLFGSSTLSGFVLDQNSYSGTDSFVPQLAAAVPLGQPATNYAFNQPATATSVPASIGASRTTQTLSGYFGGIMYPNFGGTLGSPYPVIGTATVQTDAINNRVAATLSGSDPLTSQVSGINSLVINFGSVTGNNYARSTFIDDNTFAAAESPSTPSQINGVNLPTPVSTNFSSSGLQPRLALVSSGTLGPNSNTLLPPGGLCSTCQFLQWGYWTGVLDTPNGDGTAALRQDAAHINTWIAGQPTSTFFPGTLPPSGTGTFNGNALGSVTNAGASYLASGGFSASYNFGTHIGTVAISNFDNGQVNVSGQVNGAGSSYSATNLTGTFGNSALSGVLNGSFYGPSATETGGNFALQGSKYLASGIFAGKRSP
jgi:trimeric autotransporter adhesin